MDWLYLAVVVGVVVCLLDRDWSQPFAFRPYYSLP